MTALPRRWGWQHYHDGGDDSITTTVGMTVLPRRWGWQYYHDGGDDSITTTVLTDNELFFSFVCFTVYTFFRNRMLWGISVWNPWHGLFLQTNTLHFYCLWKWTWGWGQLYTGMDGDSYLRGWMGTGTISKLVAGIGVGMGIKVAGTVRDGYKYLSPCSSLCSSNTYIICGPSAAIATEGSRWIFTGRP